MESVLDVVVSYYSNYFSKDARNVSLLQILNTQRHKELVLDIRALESKAEKNQKKQLLPAFTPSGTFEPKKDSGLIKHSGLIAIDIDSKENENVENFHLLKQELAKVINIAYCGLSVSGNGYWALIPIIQPSLHKDHFKAIVSEFKQIGLNIDVSGCNVSRMRGVSYDPDAYFNHQAVPHRLPKMASVQEVQMPLIKMMSDVKRNVITLIEQIKRTGIDITCEYETWFCIGCSFANEFGEDGRYYFHQVSKNYHKYSIAGTDAQFDQCLNGNYQYRIETFYHHCAKYGLYYRRVG